MIRMPTSSAAETFAIAVALASLAGCSSAPSTGGGGWGGTTGGATTAGGTTTGGTSPSSGSNGSANGGASTSGTPTTGNGATSNSGAKGTNSGSSTGTSSNGSGTGSSTGSSTPANPSSGSGTAMMTGTPTSGSSTGSNSGMPAMSNGIPTAQGFTTGPAGATDLAAPPADMGIQFSTPPGAYTVQPGQEIFPNYCVTVTNDIQVGGFQSWMTLGSSHHFILYNNGAQSAATANGQCGVGGHSWMYATSTPGAVVTENFPPNVGLDLPANTQLTINMHFINAGSTAGEPQVKINLLTAQNVMYQAGTMTSFNVTINVPAASAAGPGTQTVSGTCTAPAGANFFSMSTHTHKHATAAWVEYNHNGQTTEIVHTGSTNTYPADQEPGSGTDWEHPGIGLWVSPNYLTVQAGDTFTYNCSYVNMDSTPVTVGETAASNEMCMAVGYYFPAGSTYCQ